MINKSSNIADKVSYVFNHFSIENSLMDDMINGQLKDMNNNSINTSSELEQYCYQVAGTVGCMIFTILAPDLLLVHRKSIINVGIAMQLTNILRDIYEDAKQERLFVPKELLVKFNINKSDFLKQQPDVNIKNSLYEIANLAFDKYSDLNNFINKVTNYKNKFALKLSIIVYKEILIKIMSNGFYDISQKIYVTKSEKIKLLLKTFLTI